MVAGFSALAAAIAILAPDLIGVIAPAEWAPAADVTAVVAFGSAANAAALMFASGIYLARATRVMPLLTLVAAGINVATNLVLIPRIGIMGAAWATLLAYAALAAMTAIVAERRHPVHFDLARLGLVAAVADRSRPGVARGGDRRRMVGVGLAPGDHDRRAGGDGDRRARSPAPPARRPRAGSRNNRGPRLE